MLNWWSVSSINIINVWRISNFRWLFLMSPTRNSFHTTLWHLDSWVLQGLCWTWMHHSWHKLQLIVSSDHCAHLTLFVYIHRHRISVAPMTVRLLACRIVATSCRYNLSLNHLWWATLLLIPCGCPPAPAILGFDFQLFFLVLKAFKSLSVNDALSSAYNRALCQFFFCYSEHYEAAYPHGKI